MARTITPQEKQLAGVRGNLRRVFVHGLEVVGSIGIFEHEKRYEQRVVVSVDLWVADDYDGASDRLADVVDYATIVKAIRQVVEADHVNLIETVAERIAQRCLVDVRVEHVHVKIEKPDVFPDVSSIGIEIERGRRS